MARDGGERRWRACSRRFRRSAHSSRPMHVYWLADVASAACASQATFEWGSHSGCRLFATACQAHVRAGWHGLHRLKQQAPLPTICWQWPMRPYCLAGMAAAGREPLKGMSKLSTSAQWLHLDDAMSCHPRVVLFRTSISESVTPWQHSSIKPHPLPSEHPGHM